MVLQQGFIALHRSLLDWEWYKDTNTKTVFIHLLLTVNYYPKKWRGEVIGRGQRVCTYAGLAEETGLSLRQTRTALEHLQATHEVTWSGCKNYSVVQVVNYDKYQEATRTATLKRHATDTQSDIQPTFKRHLSNKAIKNNIIIPPYNPPKEKGGGGGVGLDPEFAELVKRWEEVTAKLITPAEGKKIADLQNRFSVDWVQDAMGIAADNAARKLSYVEAVLERWQREGRNAGKNSKGKAPQGYVDLDKLYGDQEGGGQID